LFLLFLALYLWPILLSSFVPNSSFRVHNILTILYWDSIFPEKEKKNRKKTTKPPSLHQVYPDHTSLFTSAPLPPNIPLYTSTSITMASSIQPLLNLDPEHISCIGGRTVVTCKGCAGNAPRYIPPKQPFHPYLHTKPLPEEQSASAATVAASTSSSAHIATPQQQQPQPEQPRTPQLHLPKHPAPRHRHPPAR
jgi:hypothetical protein